MLGTNDHARWTVEGLWLMVYLEYIMRRESRGLRAMGELCVTWRIIVPLLTARSPTLCRRRFIKPNEGGSQIPLIALVTKSL